MASSNAKIDSTVEIGAPLDHPLQLLPNELLLVTFSFLDLKSYIAAHGVCKKWRKLVPLAEIHPIRKQMFDLYHHMIQHPHFLETRPYTLRTLQPFGRKAYIDALLSQYPAVPEEFRLWIMEWPERMVPFGMWPGSPFAYHWAVTLEQAEGANWLAYLPEGSPSLLTILHRHPSHSDHCIPALLLWQEFSRVYWLIFEKDEPELFGRVIITDIQNGDVVVVCRIPHAAGAPNKYPIVYNSWLQFLRSRWDEHLDFVIPLSRYREPGVNYFDESKNLTYPVQFELGACLGTVTPAHPWVDSKDPRVLEELQGLVNSVIIFV